MTIQEQIDSYINGQTEAKRTDMQALHALILNLLPNAKLWFDDGKNEEGKTVSNPSVGYGSYIIKYADGKTREFFQTGISANTSGITVYIMGIPDRTYLPQTFANRIGKASVTSYCIKFKQLKDIDIDVLSAAIKYGVEIIGRN